MSVWMLRRWYPTVTAACEKHGLPTKDLESFAKRVAVLRHQIFAHNAISAVDGQGALFAKADLKGGEVDRFAARLSAAIRQVYRSLFNQDPPRYEEFAGEGLDRIYERFGR